MFWFKSHKPNIEDDLRNLVKSGKNTTIKSLINAANPSDLIDCTGTTIFHLAAKYSNIDLIQFLLDSGYDVNVRNAYGTTPLLMAILHYNYGVVKYLLDVKADVFATNSVGQSSLQLLIDKKMDVPASVTRHLIMNLKNCDVDAAVLADIFLENDCSLEFALTLENADVTRAMLNRTEEISMDRAYDLLLVAMNSNYMNNIEALLHHGHKAVYRRKKFLDIIADRLFSGTSVELKSVRAYIERFGDWDVIDDSFVQTLEKIFATSSKIVLEFLIDCNIEIIVRRKFGRDLLVNMLVNQTEGVIELLRDKKFDVDARGNRDGQTGLHAAARYIIPERMRFLLNRGANPNAKDRNGRTPLHLAWDVECIELLLRNDADIQVIDYSGLTVFDRTKNLGSVMEILIGELAIVEGKGVMIKKKIFDRIQKMREFKEFFDVCKRQIEWMRGEVVKDGVTMFEILVGKFDEDLERDEVDEMLRRAKDYGLHRFYVRVLCDMLKCRGRDC